MSRARWSTVALSALVVLALAGGCTPRGRGAAGPAQPAPRVSLDATQLAQLLDEARKAVDSGDPAKALELASQYAEYAPDDAEMRGIRGRALLAQKQYDKAAEDLEAAVTSESSDPDLRLSLAEAFDSANRPDLAEPHLRAAARQIADDAWAYYNDGLLLEELGKTQQAADAFREADELEPGNPEILLARARALLAAGQPEQARDNAWGAVESLADPESGLPRPEGDLMTTTAQAYEILARSELAESKKAGDEGERGAKREIAKSWLAKLPEVVKDPALARFHQARVWREAGEPDVALAALDGAEPPKDAGWAQAELARILVAQGKDCAKAAQAAGRAIELDGPDADLLGLQGWALYKAKDYGEARGKLAEALKLARTNRERGEINYRLFRTCEALSDTAAAQQYREAAKKLGFKEPT